MAWPGGIGPWPGGLTNAVLDTVGWVIWPIKIVPDMTHNVFGGTLNHTQSLSVVIGWQVSSTGCSHLHLQLCFLQVTTILLLFVDHLWRWHAMFSVVFLVFVCTKLVPSWWLHLPASCLLGCIQCTALGTITRQLAHCIHEMWQLSHGPQW